ncbi:hypothetical protein QF91_003387 [Salmonella enterica subsp. salamae]|nr:hypothetical protein [Salmonella enterica subsp. salamae]EJH2657177.1 hypothetical protein [Salmonella enterica]
MTKKTIVASAGGTVSGAVTPNRPSWASVRSNYPDNSVSKAEFYPKISKALALSIDSPAYTNTCALRMSYALNKSGVRLGSPPGNGRVTGDDGVVYWLRVKELRRKLFKLFDDPDFHLLYPERMPDPLLNECDLNARICDANAYVKDYPDEYKARLDYAYSNFMPNVKGKNGIIVFDVKGWGDATGHFTLWEDGNLLYVSEGSEENNPSSPSYYVWYIDPRIEYNADRTFIPQTVEVHFWELK